MNVPDKEKLLDEINRRYEELRAQQETANHQDSARKRQVSNSEQTIADLKKEIHRLECDVRDRDETIRRLSEELRLKTAEPVPAAVSQTISPPAPNPATVREHLITALMQQPASSITVVQMTEAGRDGERLANEFCGVFSAAQWKVGRAISSFKENRFSGIQVVHDDSFDAAQGAKLIAAALRGASMDCVVKRAPFPTEFERIRLVVGVNPNGKARTLAASIPQFA